MKSHLLIKILCLIPLIAVGWARTEDDQDRPTLRGTNTSNPGSSLNGPFPGFGANPGFRQQADQSPFGNGFQQQGGLRQQQQQQFLPQQFDGIAPFQGGLQQQNLLRPDLALLQQQNNNLRQPNNFANNPFANPLLNQGSAQFNQFGNQDFNRNPSSFQQLQQQSFGLSPFHGQGLQSALGSNIQGQFPGQFDQQQQNALLLALLQHNSFDGQQSQQQFGGRPQLNAGSAFESQRQLALQQQLLSQLGLVQPNPFQQSFNSFSNDAQFNRPSRPSNLNTGSSGSSSLNSANQVLLQGGQFADPSFSSRPFINSNRFPFQSGLLANGLLFDANNNNNNFGSQFAGSQFDWTLNRNQASKQRPNRPSFHDGGQPIGFGGNQDQFGRVDPFFHGSPSSSSKSSFWNDIDRGNDQTFASQAELERYKLMQQLNRQASRFPDSSVLGTRFGSPITQNPFADDPVRMPNVHVDNKKPDEIPDTGFSCEGRAPGHYADVSAGCRVFHLCQLDGSKSSFVCGNGTLFDQSHTVCHWADDVDCAKSQLFYPQTHRPTTQEPVRTQIPTPSNPASTTTTTQSPQRPNQGVPSSAHGLVFGQPNIAMGSLDAGRSIKDSNDRSSRPFSLYAPPNIRPSFKSRQHD